MVKAIAWYLSNSYHRPRSSSFCWFWSDQSWLGSPYHRWCTSLPRDINIWGRDTNDQRALIEAQWSCYPTAWRHSHFTRACVLIIHLSSSISLQLTGPGSPIYQVHQRHFSEGSFSLIKHQYWVGWYSYWLIEHWYQTAAAARQQKSLCEERGVRNNGEANVECRHLSQTPLW